MILMQQFWRPSYSKYSRIAFYSVSGDICSPSSSAGRFMSVSDSAAILLKASSRCFISISSWTSGTSSSSSSIKLQSFCTCTFVKEKMSLFSLESFDSLIR